MALNLSTRGQLGIALMVLGTIAFLPTIFPGQTGLLRSGLILAAAVVLTYGTWLFGTDVDGRAV